MGTQMEIDGRKQMNQRKTKDKEQYLNEETILRGKFHLKVYDELWKESPKITIEKGKSN